jgi:hypothetical protein
MNVFLWGCEEPSYLILRVGKASHRAVILDSDEKFASVGICEGDKCPSYVFSYRLDAARLLLARFTLECTLELTELALAHSECKLYPLLKVKDVAIGHRASPFLGLGQGAEPGGVVVP